MNMVALDHLLQFGEFLGKGPFQLVVIHQGVGVAQLFTWRARGGENEGVLHMLAWESGTHSASLSPLTNL